MLHFALLSIMDIYFTVDIVSSYFSMGAGVQ